jgi:tRNA (guanine26-N2/guanine27-N2)-dimethyltransferase
MITYNCESCGSWSNQHIGKIYNKENKLKFQLNPGPSTDQHCQHCRGRQMVNKIPYALTQLAGPMWAGPLHDKIFLDKLTAMLNSLDDNIYKTRRRMLGMVSLASEVATPISALTSGIVGPVLPNSPRTCTDTEIGDPAARRSLVRNKERRV